MVSHQQLRESFFSFWQKNNHLEVPPISLVPKEDPTTLFTGSGMQQLVPYLQGEPHPLGKKLYNIQACFRSEDIEEVGDNRHTTFFEMMGNWSLGDYFKKEQLPWCWEYYTKIVGLPKEKLFVTVFEGGKGVPKDEESATIWKKLGIKDDHIFYYGVEHNWWSRSGPPENMPPGEIGGPDSEVFYDFGEKLELHEKSGIKGICHPNCNCGRFLEIGNSVFIQYKKKVDGSLEELPQKNVDFGGGVERLATTISNKPDMFETDLYMPVIKEIEDQTNKKYEDHKFAMQVIADHLKAATFMMADGVEPSNKEQGYILRRLIRRSVVKMQKLGAVPLKLAPKTCSAVINIYSQVYLKDIKANNITAGIGNEINKFLGVLNRGTKLLSQSKKIDGRLLFDLQQSYGFPLEVSEEILGDLGVKLSQKDKKEFYQEFEKHKAISRTGAVRRFKGGLADESEQTIKYHTATHLIHQALFDVFGEGNLRQDGSNITQERLRFDFSTQKKPTQDDIKKTESIVNQKIKEKLPVHFEIMPRKKAEEIGARAFFKEKYADQVKIYFVGDYSKEFCGGPHVKNTKEIGKISIYKFEKIGSNIYRIYAK